MQNRVFPTLRFVIPLVVENRKAIDLAKLRLWLFERLSIKQIFNTGFEPFAIFRLYPRGHFKNLLPQLFILFLVFNRHKLKYILLFTLRTFLFKRFELLFPQCRQDLFVLFYGRLKPRPLLAVGLGRYWFEYRWG